MRGHEGHGQGRGVKVVSPADLPAARLAADHGRGHDRGHGHDHGPAGPATATATATAATDMAAVNRQGEAEALVQRLLAPFIAELGAVREELGRVKAERDAARAELAALQTIGRPMAAPQASPAARGEAEAGDTTTTPGGALGAVRRLWRALRGE